MKKLLAIFIILLSLSATTIVEGKTCHYPVVVEIKGRSINAILRSYDHHSKCSIRFRIWDIGEMYIPPEKIEKIVITKVESKRIGDSFSKTWADRFTVIVHLINGDILRGKGWKFYIGTHCCPEKITAMVFNRLK